MEVFFVDQPLDGFGAVEVTDPDKEQLSRRPAGAVGSAASSQ
jgi:hypothetical protein